MELRRFALAGVLAGAFVIALCPLVPAGDGAPTLTEGEQRAGWKLLFDGKTSKGWRGFKKEAFPEEGWSIEDGWLHVGGGGGDIITVGQYENFELSLEWKAAPKANSGIMYLEEEGTPWMTAPEYQVFDDPDPHSTENTSAGGLYGLYSPTGKTLRPSGEVNRTRIVIAGPRIEHGLNGFLVLTAMRGSEDWNERVKASKFSSMPKFGLASRGHICLQDHGDDVWFRHIKIRELSPEEAALGPRKSIDLFDGRSLDGWTYHLNEEGASWEDTWQVRDGIIVCKGTPAGYIRTMANHTNYHLVVEWRWSPYTKKGGNSGVLMRMVGEDKVWPRCIEAQLMSGRAGDFYNIGEFPMQPDPERTRVHPQAAACQPSGTRTRSASGTATTSSSTAAASSCASTANS